MSLLYYSNSADKKVATYLDLMAQFKLDGADNSYTRMLLGQAAIATLHQIMRDNEEVIGYQATLSEIKMEIET